jgi:DNA polymerase/3'-5' exonuclease PolX
VKQRHPLIEAEAVAQELRAILGPACQQFEVAGSIRRRLPEVGDIELLCVPGPGGSQLLGACSLLDQEILGLIETGVLAYRLDQRGRRTFGPWNKYLVHRPSGIPLDIFSTTVQNWGMSLLVRTGPREWNIKVMSRFKALGMRGHAYGGVTDGHGSELTCPSESGVFKLLGWQFLEPESRR